MSKVSTGAVTELRRRISGGDYAPGVRLTEVEVARDLGVSRTPVRLAFRTLEQEGLLQRSGGRGYLVREFSQDDVLCGLEVRGVLEGLAARRLAERGLSPEVKTRLDACLETGDRLFEQCSPETLDIDEWSALNQRFHTIIVEAAGSAVIHDAIARNNHLPFASSDSIIIDPEAMDREYHKLQLAQWQHKLIVQALRAGEGARAESLMREHANIGVRYGHLFGLKPLTD